LAYTLCKLLLELTPSCNHAAEPRMLRAVRVIEPKKRALRKRIRAALRHRVLRIAIHLDGAEGVRLDQYRNRTGRKRMSAGKEHRAAKNKVLWLLYVGKNRLIRLLRATRESRQRKACTHHLQEAAPRDGVNPLASTRLPRKLLLHELMELRRLCQLIQILPEAPPGLAVELRPNLRKRHLLPRSRRDRCNNLSRRSICCRRASVFQRQARGLRLL